MKTILILATCAMPFSRAALHDAAAAEPLAPPVGSKDAGHLKNTVEDLAGEAAPARAGKPWIRYEQTLGGVTARIEKITLESIVNVEAWLRKEYGLEWQKHVRADFRAEPVLVARVFLSLSGPMDGSERRVISYNFGDNVSRSEGVAEYDPPIWKTRLPDMELADEARGVILWAVVEEKTKIEQYFPVKINIKLTTEDGQRVRLTLAGAMNDAGMTYAAGH